MHFTGKRQVTILAALFVLATASIGSAAAPVEAGSAATSASVDTACVPAVRDGKAAARFMTLHASFLKRAKEGPIDLLFLGDSITERWTSSSQTWQKYYGKRNAANFGISGDRTQHVLWRIDNGELDGISPKVLVLMIGTNNTNSDSSESIVRAITKIVGSIRSKLPETKILLLAIFPREPKKPGDANKQMDAIKQVNPEIAKLADGKNVRYLDITNKFLVDGKVPKTTMPDGLHPNAAGYEIWAEAMEPTLAEMMK